MEDLELIAEMQWDDKDYYNTGLKRGHYFLDTEGSFWIVKPEVCYPRHPGLDMKKYNDESLFDKAPLMPESFYEEFHQNMIGKNLIKYENKKWQFSQDD